MNTPKAKGKVNPRVILAGGLVAAIVALFFLLRSCAPGLFGIGEGEGTGKTDQETKEQIKKELEVSRSVHVTITGENCFFKKDKQDCEGLCATIRELADDKTTVVLDSAKTSQQFAEEFRQCLRKDDVIKNITRPTP